MTSHMVSQNQQTATKEKLLEEKSDHAIVSYHQRFLILLKIRLQTLSPGLEAPQDLSTFLLLHDLISYPLPASHLPPYCSFFFFLTTGILPLQDFDQALLSA